MKTRTICSLCCGLMALILLISACGTGATPVPNTPTAPIKIQPTQAVQPTERPQRPEIVVIIQGGKCTLEGSPQIPERTFRVNLVNKDPARGAAVGLVTLDAGKSMKDLEAWPSTDPPEWVHALGAHKAAPGKTAHYIHFLVDKPIYLVCFDRTPEGKEAKIGVLGPITVQTTERPLRPEIVVTIQGGKCTLEGSAQIPAGTFMVNLVNKDPARGAALAIVTLDAGKSKKDLEAWPSTDPPEWAQGEARTAAPGETDYIIFALKDKPIYLVCMDKAPGEEAKKIGVLGPIEIIE